MFVVFIVFVDFIINEMIEQKVCLKFCVANIISCVGVLKMYGKVYSNEVLSKTWAYEWYKAFKKGREIIKTIPYSRRPSTPKTNSNVKKVKQILFKNCYTSYRELAHDFNIFHETVRTKQLSSFKNSTLNKLFSICWIAPIMILYSRKAS